MGTRSTGSARPNNRGHDPRPGTVPVAEALKLAARHHKSYVLVHDKHGMPLHIGRARLANPAQRLALIATERGCTRPGCTAPATMTAVHHVTDWSKGGPTDIKNLTLACDHCHALVNDGPDGWKTIKMPQGSEFPGRTGWIAPPHLDPTGTARVNHQHHPEELMATAPHPVRSMESVRVPLPGNPRRPQPFRNRLPHRPACPARQ